MTLQQLKDERVEQAKNKIFSELMMISYLIIVASFCIKAVYFNMTLNQCATEFIIMIFAPLYQAVRSRQMGVVLADGKNRPWKQHLYVLGIAIVLFLLVMLRNRMNGQWVNNSTEFSAGMIFLVVFFAIFAAVRFCFVRLEQRRAERLERQYDDET